jgi:hypothetical protein
MLIASVTESATRRCRAASIGVVTTEREGISTVEHVRQTSTRRRSWLYGITTAALVVVVGLACIEGAGWIDAYGVNSATVRASGGGYDLSVDYGSVTRPALATPFEIVVSRADGFDQPVTVVVDRAYLSIWDENGLVPAPASETVRGEWVEWEFDPPSGNALTIMYDARIEPGVQSGQDGAVGVIEDDAIVAEVRFHTAVRP